MLELPRHLPYAARLLVRNRLPNCLQNYLARTATVVTKMPPAHTTQALYLGRSRVFAGQVGAVNQTVPFMKLAK